jgi:hypothetical protein
MGAIVALSKKPAFGAGDDGTHALGNSAMIVSNSRSVFTPAGLLSAVMAAWTRVLCGGYSHTHSYLPHF